MSTNLSLRPARLPLSMEKWNIGTLMADGSVLLLNLGGVRAMGTQWAGVTAELHRPGNHSIKSSATARSVRGGGRVLQWGPARIDHDKLFFETPQLAGELSFHARYPPAQIKEVLLKDGNRKIQWHVEIPDADVEGRITWPKGHRNVIGRGFRDRVYYDMYPWRPHFRELRWGRAMTQHHAAIWIGGQSRKETFEAMWHNGSIHTASDPLVEMQNMRTISRSTMVRSFLSRLSGSPVETKQTGKAVLMSEVGVCLTGDLRWAKRL